MFYALCVRNIDGDTDFVALRQFAVGYNISRFKVNTRVIMNTQTDYDSLEMHVLMCKVCMY